MDVTSRDFEAQASLFLRRAEAGETFVVTDQGRAIAELRPAQTSADKEEGALLELARAGLITPPIRQKSSTGQSLQLSGPPISQAIVEDRKDRI